MRKTVLLADSKALKHKIMTALSAVRHGEDNIVSQGMISSLEVTENGNITFSIEVDPALGPQLEPLRQIAEDTVRGLEGVASVTAILTAQRTPPKDAQPDPHGMNKNPPLALHIKKIIAVGSGKGGVGKSTVAFNLAVALSAQGYSVGLLDADIYGPSVPRLSGLPSVKPPTNEQGKIIPFKAHGLSLMSMGFLVEEEKPMIWRGPMVQTAFYQMLRDVVWNDGCDGDLDILVIDMPPGTGDVQLTLAQKVPVDGAVIVSTPQDLALIDARKAIAMFEKTHVPVLGIIENMSTYICQNCGHEEHIFGHGGAEQEAQKSGIDFLGGIPLDRAIRQKSDDGIAQDHPAYAAIASQIIKKIS
jgi:ATP-binding protein involved in chromosome partitioning